ncbi:MAG TPA: hypothetical protein VM163_13250 [bacterium]|nr:hypothetical protein [bacterium]
MNEAKRTYSKIQEDFAKWDSETRRLLREANLAGRESMGRDDVASAIDAHHAYEAWRVGDEIKALGAELARDYPDSHLCKLVNDHLRREEKSHRMVSIVKDLNERLAKACSGFRFKVAPEPVRLGEIRALMAGLTEESDRAMLFSQLAVLNEQIEPLIREGQRRLAKEHDMSLADYCRLFLQEQWQLTGNTAKLLYAVFSAGRQLVRLVELDGCGLQDLFHYHKRSLDEADAYFGPELPTEQCFQALKALGFDETQTRRIRVVVKPGTTPAHASALNLDEDLCVEGSFSAGAWWFRVLVHEMGHCLCNIFSPKWPTIRGDPIYLHYGEILAELPAAAASTAHVLGEVLAVDDIQAERIGALIRRSRAMAFVYDAVRADFSMRIWQDTSSSFDDLYAQVCADYGLGVPEPGAFFPPVIFDVLSPVFITHAFGSCLSDLFLNLTLERAAKLWPRPIIAPLLIGETYHLWCRCSVADYLLESGCKLEPGEILPSFLA